MGKNNKKPLKSVKRNVRQDNTCKHKTRGNSKEIRNINDSSIKVLNSEKDNIPRKSYINVNKEKPNKKVNKLL